MCINVNTALLNREDLSQNLHLADLGLKASAAIPFSDGSAMISLDCSAPWVVRSTRWGLCLTSSLVQDCLVSVEVLFPQATSQSLPYVWAEMWSHSIILEFSQSLFTNLCGLGQDQNGEGLGTFTGETMVHLSYCVLPYRPEYNYAQLHNCIANSKLVTRQAWRTTRFGSHLQAVQRKHVEDARCCPGFFV